MGVYVPKKKIDRGRVGMATKRVVIDVDLHGGNCDCNEETVQYLEAITGKEIPIAAQSSLEVLKEWFKTERIDLVTISDKLSRTSGSIEPIEDKQIKALFY